MMTRPVVSTLVGPLRAKRCQSLHGVKAYMVATATKVRSSYAGTLQRKLAPTSPGVLSSDVPLTVFDPLKRMGGIGARVAWSVQ
jgi:hypothetical protein